MRAQKIRPDDHGLAVISAKMAKALGSELRCAIVAKLSIRPMSPSEFSEETDYELSQAARGFRQLAGYGFIEVIEERKGGHRRGGVEHVYRRIQRAFFDTPSWKALPAIVKDDMTAKILSSYIDLIREAVESETFDAEDDRHLSWDQVALDRKAWTELMAKLDEVLIWLPELESESAERVKGGDEELIRTTVGLGGFRSPAASARK